MAPLPIVDANPVALIAERVLSGAATMTPAAHRAFAEARRAGRSPDTVAPEILAHARAVYYTSEEIPRLDRRTIQSRVQSVEDLLVRFPQGRPPPASPESAPAVA
jgi:hypothetical protein